MAALAPIDPVCLAIFGVLELAARVIPPPTPFHHEVAR